MKAESEKWLQRANWARSIQVSHQMAADSATGELRELHLWMATWAALAADEAMACTRTANAEEERRVTRGVAETAVRG